MTAPDRVWSTIKERVLRPFGSALEPRTDGRIVKPALITEPTRRLTRRELRQPPCEQCGNRGVNHCQCEEPAAGVPPIPVEHLRALLDRKPGR